MNKQACRRLVLQRFSLRPETSYAGNFHVLFTITIGGRSLLSEVLDDYGGSADVSTELFWLRKQTRQSRLKVWVWDGRASRRAPEHPSHTLVSFPGASLGKSPASMY